MPHKYRQSARNRLWRIWLSFAVLICFSAGQVSSGWALSLSDEKKLGRQILNQIRERLPLVEDGEVVNYLQSVGGRVVRQLDGSPFQYQFFLINEATPNAFAIPGGYVFIYRGLINLMQSEGELASIISHEIAHIQARHISHRIEQGRVLSIATVVGMLLGAFLGGGGDASRALATGVAAGARTLELQYSREDEEEADRLGFYYLEKAGYDPQDMVNMMRTMNRTNWRTDSRIPNYLYTHPGLAERVAYLEKLAAKESAGSPKKQDQDTQGDFPLMQATLVSEFEEPRVAMDRFHALERQKKQAIAAYGMGRLYLRQGQPEQALAKLREAAGLKVNSPMILTSMGAAYYQLGRLPEAKKVLTTALMLDPSAPVTHFRLAEIARESGQLDEAVQHLRQAEQMAPMLPEVDYQLGVLLGQTKEYGLAHYHLGNYYRHQKDWKLAIFHYEKAQKLLTNSPAKVAEIDEELKELQSEKRKEAREAASGDKSRKPVTYRWVPSAPMKSMSGNLP